MLGSAHDADDALQDALLRAWRALGRFEGRSATYLASLDRHQHLPGHDRAPAEAGAAGRLRAGVRSRRGGRRAARAGGLWIEPYPDREIGVEDGPASPEARWEERESVELAFIAALQHLPPRQRAALILRDVLGFSARETAEALDTTSASVNSALQRARKTVDRALPERSQQATVRALGNGHMRDMVRALQRGVRVRGRRGDPGDAGRGRHLRDAPIRGLVQGPGRDRRLVADARRPSPRLRYIATSANGQPALGTYGLRDQAPICRSPWTS